jgi:hypothetical protein
MDALVALGLFLSNVVLTYPLFLPGDTPYRDSIEGGYAAMARFVDAHPNPWGWNPLQYCGVPTQFLYVPMLSYLVALLPGDPPHTYKVLTATLTCLGPATLYLCLVFFTGSRIWAALTAIAYTLLSPMYGLVAQADKDRGITYLPWRMHVYAKYGEGPHNAGLTLMPLAWMLAWTSATTRRYVTVFLLAVLMAAITLTNWIAGLALAITLVLMMGASVGVPEFRPLRLFMAGALAYGLACFWLTPTFIRTIAFNWPTDAFDYKLQMAQYTALAWYLVIMAGTWLFVRWLRWPFWERFVSLAVVAFAFPVMMHYGAGIDMIPESRRYAMEFELFLAAAMGAFARFAFSSGEHVRKACGVVAVLAFLLGGAKQMRQYITQPRSHFRPLTVQSTPEHQVATWLAQQKPQGRVLVSGGLRFRLNSWYDVQQVGGGFESGLRNRTPVEFAYHIRTDLGSKPGMEVADSIREMKALGVQYVVVHGRESAEHYRDYKNPTKFEGALDKVYDTGADIVYRVPFHGLAHAVYPHEEPGWAFRDALEPYVKAIEDEARPQLTARWLDNTRLLVEGSVPEGMMMSVQVSYDRGWSATSNGRSVPVEKDNLGFMKLHATGPVDLKYRGTAEQKVFAGVSLLTWAGALLLLWKSRR